MQPNPSKARQVRAENVAAQQFVINWHSSGSSIVTGIAAASDTLHVSINSLRCYLATGKGTHQRTMTNPITGEPDIVTVTRLPAPPKPRPKRGRPVKAKRADPAVM